MAGGPVPWEETLVWRRRQPCQAPIATPQKGTTQQALGRPLLTPQLPGTGKKIRISVSTKTQDAQLSNPWSNPGDQCPRRDWASVPSLLSCPASSAGPSREPACRGRGEVAGLARLPWKTRLTLRNWAEQLEGKGQERLKKKMRN